jgi:hypothetical protein
MCRNIHTLFNYEPPATQEEVRDDALQYVRKISGFTKPSQANEAAFVRAVDEGRGRRSAWSTVSSPQRPRRTARGQTERAGARAASVSQPPRTPDTARTEINEEARRSSSPERVSRSLSEIVWDDAATRSTAGEAGTPRSEVGIGRGGPWRPEPVFRWKAARVSPRFEARACQAAQRGSRVDGASRGI